MTYGSSPETGRAADKTKRNVNAARPKSAIDVFGLMRLPRSSMGVSVRCSPAPGPRPVPKPPAGADVGSGDHSITASVLNDFENTCQRVGTPVALE